MSTFKFHSGVGETVPWNARYEFPTQQTKVSKHLVKLPPKNGQNFTAGQIVRIEFPSDNYLNALNSTLQFDLTVNNMPATTGFSVTATAAGSQSITSNGNLNLTANVLAGQFFTRVDPISGVYTTYTVVEHPAVTGAAATLTLDKPLRNDITAGVNVVLQPNVRLPQAGAHNLIGRIRILYGSLVIEDIQQYSKIARLLYEMGVHQGYMGSSGGILDGCSGGRWCDQKNLRPGEYVPGDVLSQLGCQSGAVSRTFCLNLFTGLLTCKKLIPLKWMAAQLAIELTLNTDANSFMSSSPLAGPTMALSNINFVTEMVEFDSTYDSAFFQGLSSGGVPLKFSSWHYHSFNVSGSNQIYQIHERSRSVKMVLAVVCDANAATVKTDADLFFHDLNQYSDPTSGVITGGYSTGSLINTFQFRIGGRYYPSQPVRSVFGGAEAYQELLKCIDTLGDYRSDTNIHQLEWQAQGNITAVNNYGVPGGYGTKFIMAASFENTDVSPDAICGINAEEQSDIALIVTCGGSGPQSSGPKTLHAFVAYDSMIIIRDGNVVDLIL